VNNCRYDFSEAHLQCTDTFIASARPETADETVASGMDKSVPYMVRREIQQRTTGLRSSYGLFQRPEPGDRKRGAALIWRGSFPVLSVASTPGSRNMRIRSCVNAPLKRKTKDRS